MRQTISAVTTVTPHTGQSLSELPLALARIQPVAINSATTMGAMPCLKARTARKSRLRWPHWAAA